jgi:hypothetical protein
MARPYSQCLAYDSESMPRQEFERYHIVTVKHRDLQLVSTRRTHRGEEGGTSKGVAPGQLAGPLGELHVEAFSLSLSLTYLLLLALVASFPTAASALPRDRRDLLHLARIGGPM